MVCYQMMTEERGGETVLGYDLELTRFCEEILGTFGQNVDTVSYPRTQHFSSSTSTYTPFSAIPISPSNAAQSNGDDWIRHRKLTAPCFSERASTTVWTHALSQSQSMLSIWLSSPTSTTSTMIKDTSTLALNVISAVAFENHNVNHPAPGHTLSLRDALVTVMSTAISPALEGIMPWLGLLRLRVLLPAPIKRLHVAMAEFRTYMDETVVREREKMSTEGEAKVLNLISTLIKANDAAKKDDAASKARLSDVELRGNIFIFTVGGLESTAITVAYSLALLAVHPEIQDWVAEEVDGIEGGMEDYAKVFPRLKRVMAVMVSLTVLSLP